MVTSHPADAHPFFPMTDKIVILCTCGSEADAGRIARALVEERLAACVNVIPHIASTYRWKEQVETAAEWLLVIKSSRPLFAALGAAVARLHPYVVPELLALPVLDGSAPYLAWLDESLQGATGQ